ncbi:MAG: hypothetical protein GC159_11975 [Phycisphaera sp.]|nr:hypothetical protein [Phycisphaera sp.]
MNCQHIQQQWDAYRDGDLAGPDREAFERHLRECDACGELWRREALWLQALGETPADLADPFYAADFAERAIDRWQRPRVGVIGRIVRWGAIAACVLFVGVVTLAVISGGGKRDRGATPGDVAVINKPPVKHDKVVDKPKETDVAANTDAPDSPDAEATDPVSVLVLDVNKQISDQPSNIRQTYNETASLLSFGQMINMLTPSRPAKPGVEEQRTQ